MARKLWTIVSRLGYCVYLVFPIVAGNFSSSMSSPLYLTYNEMFYLMIFNIAGSLFVSLAVYIMVEHPVQKLLVSKIK